MTDQQDLRARLPELPEPGLISSEAEFVYAYDADDMRAYALEAAAQLGRVGSELAVVDKMLADIGGICREGPYTGSYTDCVRAAYNDAAKYRQLPAGVPDGWALVPVKPTESMLEALGNTPWVIDGHTEGNTFIQKEYRDQRYVTDGWEAMLNAAPSPPATPQPDSAAPGGGDVEQRRAWRCASKYNELVHVFTENEAEADRHRQLGWNVVEYAALRQPAQVGAAVDDIEVAEDALQRAVDRFMERQHVDPSTGVGEFNQRDEEYFSNLFSALEQVKSLHDAPPDRRFGDEDFSYD